MKNNFIPAIVFGIMFVLGAVVLLQYEPLNKEQER